MDRRNLIKMLAAGGAASDLSGLYYSYRYHRHVPASRTQSTAEWRRGEFPVQFVDVTSSAGISFEHNSGAFGKKYLPETLGAGCAFFDYDNDGWLDVLLVNGMDWPGHKRQRATMKLYRNNRNGTRSEEHTSELQSPDHPVCRLLLENKAQVCS